MRALDRPARAADRRPRAVERSKRLPEEAWRLTSGDSGVNNLLFDGTETLHIVDFEAGGLDDSAHMVMQFLIHGGSEGPSQAASRTFLESYASAVGLTTSEHAGNASEGSSTSNGSPSAPQLARTKLSPASDSPNLTWTSIPT
jgi:hypothetical protein